MASKKKPPTPNGCKCVAEVNRELRERGARLVGTLLVLKGQRAQVCVAIEANEFTFGGRPKRLSFHLRASYCPFCGKKYP